MKPEKRIKNTDVEEVESIADNYESLSNGHITKRQAWAFLLLEVKEVDADKVADLMNISRRTVYNHASKGGEKFKHIKVTAEAMMDDAWYLYS